MGPINCAPNPFNILLVESDLWLEPMIFHRTACSVASFGTFVSRTLPYTAYRCTVFFFFFFFVNNSQTLLFAVAMNE